MDFAFCSDGSCSSPTLLPSHPSVQVVDGVYHVVLDETGTVPPSLYNGPIWLQVKVNGELLDPPRPFSAVPYARHADTLDGVDASGFAVSGHHHDAAYVNGGEANSVTSAMVVDGQVSSADVGFNYAGSASKGGAATSAAALGANGSDCPPGQYARGVDAAGNAEGCASAAYSAGTGLNLSGTTFNLDVPLSLSGSGFGIVQGQHAGSLNLGYLGSASYGVYGYRPPGQFGPDTASVYGDRYGDAATAASGGAGWGSAEVDSAVHGRSRYGNNFTAGVAGHNAHTFPESAGVIGADDGATIMGALAYRDGNGNKIAVMGTGGDYGAWATGDVGVRAVGNTTGILAYGRDQYGIWAQTNTGLAAFLDGEVKMSGNTAIGADPSTNNRLYVYRNFLGQTPTSGEQLLKIHAGNVSNVSYRFVSAYHGSNEQFYVSGDGGAYFKGKVGIGTTTPHASAALDVNGAIYQRGGLLHADYVFQPGYEIESIEEHEAFMWGNSHLKGVPKSQTDEDGREVLDVGSHRRGMLEELEKAHIYIAELNSEILALKSIVCADHPQAKACEPQ